MRRLAPFLLLLTAATQAPADRVSDVMASSHNLTAAGRGPVTSPESRVCIFCHISHSGDGELSYLWNRAKPQAAYTPYQSPTLNAAAGNPGAARSRLCLSCHDGTIGLGQTKASGAIPVSRPLQSRDITGTNFGRHHPVGIRPVDDGQLYAGLGQTPARSANAAVRLPGNLIECVTCHDPHRENTDSNRGKFLVISNSGSALCLTCHDPSRGSSNYLNGWAGSAHQVAGNTTAELYGTVGANACLSCHLPHNPAAAVPLLRGTEENTCAQCHAGSGTTPALLSVLSQFNLAYSHPVTAQSGVHAPGENAYPLNGNRHAACSDCHNPHAAQISVLPPSFGPPALAPALKGASGVDAWSGASALRPAAREYEICFKCHADSSGKPQASYGYSRYGRTPWRVADATTPAAFNTRLEFNSLVSRHNVTYPRQRTNSEVPSLRATMLKLDGPPGRNLAPGTFIYCGDCHNNDQARNSGGGQASGVHGSSWPHVLERRYEQEAPPAAPGGSSNGVSLVPGLGGSAALCYKCHDIDNSILQNRSFKEHDRHVRGGNASCSTCHDAHGINGGNLTNNHALINFDTSIVGPSSSNILRYERTGSFTGRCYLRCHDKDHNPKSYSP